MKVLNKKAVSVLLIAFPIVISIVYIRVEEEPPPMHRLQVLISEGKLYDGYRPFSDDSIDRVCLIISSSNLRDYGLPENVGFYGYMAIAEYRQNSTNLGFANSNLLGFTFGVTDGLAYCTDVPEAIVVKKRDIWLLTGEAG
jgi:hypothetical protein